MNKQNSIEFTSPLCPSVNDYNKYKVVRQGNYSHVEVYPSDEYVTYKKFFIPYLKKLVKKLDWKMLTESTHYYLDIVIYFKRTNCDSTNYFKTVQDVGNGILYFDDKIIIGRVQRVYYTYTSKSPARMECKLYPTDYAYIGIFNDDTEYKDFIKKCKTCDKYKSGKCSKLQDFMNYKITDDFDVTNRCCLGFKEIKVKKEKIEKVKKIKPDKIEKVKKSKSKKNQPMSGQITL